jgi:nitrous oxide reductase accessory protein NosL
MEPDQNKNIARCFVSDLLTSKSDGDPNKNAWGLEKASGFFDVPPAGTGAWAATFTSRQTVISVSTLEDIRT